MKVSVKYFANFREITDVSEEKIEIESETKLKNLLNFISEKYPELGEELFNDKKLSDYVNVLVNHRNIKDADGLDTGLNNNDIVAIFPPISGG